MDGKELFNYYQTKRDFTGSKEDEYAQLLTTLDFHLGWQGENILYDMLEKAEKEGKKLAVIEYEDILVDDILVSDVKFV